jgi:hypothetical protein
MLSCLSCLFRFPELHSGPVIMPQREVDWHRHLRREGSIGQAAASIDGNKKGVLF